VNGTMDREGVLKWLKIFSIGFIILYLLEILDLFFFGTMQITVESEQKFVANLIFSSEFTDLSSSILYIFLIILSFVYLTFSVFLLRLALKQNVENIRLSKMVLMVGLIFLAANFIKLFYLYMIDNSIVSIPPSIHSKFIEIIYNFSITPLFIAIMWLYISIVASTMIISGLIFGGVGLQWFLKLNTEFRKAKK
jgi:hypothetical protein